MSQHIDERAAPGPDAVRYRKRAIPLAVRRQVAERHGATRNGPVVRVSCHHCGRLGEIHWFKYYVTSDLEFDHLIPERRGGPSTAENIVLACRRCNRRKGHRV